MPPTEDVIEEQLEGRVPWSSLGYAVLENYQQTFQRPGGVRVPAMDLSNDSVFKEMAKWTEESFEK